MRKPGRNYNSTWLPIRLSKPILHPSGLTLNSKFILTLLFELFEIGMLRIPVRRNLRGTFSRTHGMTNRPMCKLIRKLRNLSPLKFKNSRSNYQTQITMLNTTRKSMRSQTIPSSHPRASPRQSWIRSL